MRTIHGNRTRRTAFSLLEILAAITILGIISAIAVPRLGIYGSTAKARTCAVNRANIEVQAQLWYRNQGAWPAADLSDIGADTKYFPDGLPRCPVDNTSYTFSSTSRTVTGHVHAGVTNWSAPPASSGAGS